MNRSSFDTIWLCSHHIINALWIKTRVHCGQITCSSYNVKIHVSRFKFLPNQKWLSYFVVWGPTFVFAPIWWITRYRIISIMQYFTLFSINPQLLAIELCNQLVHAFYWIVCDIVSASMSIDLVKILNLSVVDSLKIDKYKIVLKK